jgi:hypothetical protein
MVGGRSLSAPKPNGLWDHQGGRAKPGLGGLPQTIPPILGNPLGQASPLRAIGPFIFKQAPLGDMVRTVCGFAVVGLLP